MRTFCLSALSGSVFSAVTPYRGKGPKAPKEGDDRRYFQLEDMAERWFEFNGQKWDDKKYWDYGCHCILLGDRPLSELGVGAPVDALDRVCKKWKMCQKCTRDRQGDHCIGEAVRYDYTWKKKAGVFDLTGNAPGSCERDLAECDHAFVLDMLTHSHVHSDSFNGFLNWDHKDPQNCVVTGTGAPPTDSPDNNGGGGGGGDGDGGDDPTDPTDPPTPTNAPSHFECCGGHDRPWLWISTETNQCCANGESRPIGEFC